MHRGRIRIPKESVLANLEWAQGTPIVEGIVPRLFLNLMIAANYLESVVKPAYHFDSVDEFVENEDRLRRGDDFVVFENEVEVVGMSYSGELDEKVELLVSNGGKKAVIVNNDRGAKDRGFVDPNNPLTGAIIGDSLTIYRSVYAGSQHLIVDEAFLAMNHAHYDRLRDFRRAADSKIRDYLASQMV
jgi:hypothetical protein